MRTDPKRWRAPTVTLVAGFMGLLDVSIVSVAPTPLLLVVARPIGVVAHE
ncbi:hypothetical protein [Pseudonocardia sp. N23]|nr:hypothetical protein [Pseudonocardia sp. N23]GAY09530.1 hypothetical protein TOK_3796 [Pseudonocardia sp. N23]